MSMIQPTKQQVTLVEITAQINAEHRNVVHYGLKQIHAAYRCGNGLTKVKRSIDHGEFTTWLDAQFEGSHRTANRYMKLYRLLNAKDVRPGMDAFEALVSEHPSIDELIQYMEEPVSSEPGETGGPNQTDADVSVEADVVRESAPSSLDNQLANRDETPPNQDELSRELATEVSAEQMEVFYLLDCDHYRTPSEITKILYKFDDVALDPCSNEGAQPNIQASSYYTKTEDGLSERWAGGLAYVNPPYEGIERWVAKAISEFECQNIGSAILFLPNRSDMSWHALLDPYCHLVIRKELTIINQRTNLRVSPWTFPFMLVYIGPDRSRFVSAFSSLGTAFQKISP